MSWWTSWVDSFIWCLRCFGRIHTIPSVPIVDCFQKIRQQVKCYLQMSGVMGKNELHEVRWVLSTFDARLLEWYISDLDLIKSYTECRHSCLNTASLTYSYVTFLFEFLWQVMMSATCVMPFFDWLIFHQSSKNWNLCNITHASGMGSNMKLEPAVPDIVIIFGPILW